MSQLEFMSLLSGALKPGRKGDAGMAKLEKRTDEHVEESKKSKSK